MAEEKNEPREVNLRKTLPWLELFRGFQIALDPRKLLLAGAGILAMAFGWWVLALLFYNASTKPDWNNYKNRPQTGLGEAEAAAKNWDAFKSDRKKWNLLHQLASTKNVDEYFEAADLAAKPEELDALEAEVKESAKAGKLSDKAKRIADKVRKPAGELATWPWFEDRGPNPYFMLTGRAGQLYQPGHFWDWLLKTEAPTLVEPLVKFIKPIVYLFHPDAGFVTRLYLLGVVLWTLAVWALFGGAITRMASVQLARRESVSIMEALRFAKQRFSAYLLAPLLPLLLLAVIVLLLSFVGVAHMWIPAVGDVFIGGLAMPFWLLLGLGMAVVLLGLISWPLMYCTISTEGTDAWEAVSRSYSYVFQVPWNFLWCNIVSILYGAVVVFFVGLVCSMMVYFGKWGMSLPTAIDARREPSFLFVYAPTSYQWREVLLLGGKTDGLDLVKEGKIDPEAYKKYVGTDSTGKDPMTWYNHTGAFLNACWLYLLFLVMLGFGYSYFWSTYSIIYLLLRKQVDDAELDEVYWEEEPDDIALQALKPIAPAPAPSSGNVQMIDTLTIRTPTTPPAPPAQQIVELGGVRPLAPPPPPPPAPTPPTSITPPLPPLPKPPGGNGETPPSAN